MIRAMVVDGEHHARNDLADLLDEFEDVDVVASCANAVSALQAVRAERPNAMFLDLQMQQVDGFQLVEMIDRELMPHVVFVSAPDEHACKALEGNGLEYLLKPVQPDRLARAVAKLRHLVGRAPRPAHPPVAIQRIPCEGATGIKLVAAEDVELVRSSEAGVYVVTLHGEYFTELTLAMLEERVPALKRCHRQYLVNLAQIDEIVRQAEGSAVLKMRSGRGVPASRRLLVRLKESLGIPHRQLKP